MAHLHCYSHVLGVALDVALLSLGRGYRKARPARLRLVVESSPHNVAILFVDWLTISVQFSPKVSKNDTKI